MGREGHDVVAMVLPSEDPPASLGTYADIVCTALGECDDDVILVGHSMNASTIAVARLRPQASSSLWLPFPLAEFPAVSCTSVITSDDRILNPTGPRGSRVTGWTPS